MKNASSSISLTGASLRNDDGQILVNDVTADFSGGALTCVLSERHEECVGLLNLVNGTRRPSTGHRKQTGRPSVATAFDLEALVPHLSARQQLRIGPLRMSLRSATERQRLCRGLQLQDVMNTVVSELSTQDQSAVVLLRCLQQDVFCYQIVSCLENLRTEVVEFAWQELSDLVRQDKLVMATFNSEHLANRTDRVIVLRNGSLAMDSPADQTTTDAIRRQMANNPIHAQYIASELMTRCANHSVDPVELCGNAIGLLKDICHHDIHCGIVHGPDHPEQGIDGDCRATDVTTWRRFLDREIRQAAAAEQQYCFYTFHCDDYDIVIIADGNQGQTIYCEMVATEFRRAAETQNRLRNLRRTVEHVGRLDSLGRIAGGVADDMNNSLTPVGCSVEVLKAMEGLPENAAEHLDVIHESVQRMSSLSQKLADFSRKGQLETDVIDLCELVEGASKMLRSTIGTHIVVECQTANRSCMVRGDRQQLENAIINLGINSRDAMPDGGRLRFAIEPQDDRIRLVVTDTGCGIPPEVQRRVFEPFFTTKGSFGTGLGLSSVEGTISEHGGTIRILDSSPTGTVFEIFLPQTTETPKPEMPVQPKTGSGQLILIVDDDSIVRTALEMSTKQLGYSTLSAAGPEEALSIFRERHAEIGLVLMDVTMPGMSGIDCMLELRNISDSLAVVLVTGHIETRTDLSELTGAGLRGVLRKPFTRDQLASVLTENVPQATN